MKQEHALVRAAEEAAMSTYDLYTTPVDAGTWGGSRC